MTTNKRKYMEPPSSENALYSKKSNLTSDLSNESTNSSQPRIDPTYGQRGAFPGLDSATEDGSLFYGPANDGLEYLRMVRSEAKTVPNLLTAPISPTAQAEKEDIYSDYSQGYYADGAYTAIPDHISTLTTTGESKEKNLDPQETYYVSLGTRFAELGNALQLPNPSQTATAAPDVLPLLRQSHRRWRGKILKTSPSTKLLGQLTQESVVCGLEVLESVLTLVNLRKGKGKMFGIWGWGLLARCREVGQMGSEEVGVLRKLGKQAVYLLRRINAGEIVNTSLEGADVEDEEQDEGTEEEEEESIADDDSAAVVDPDQETDRSSTTFENGPTTAISMLAQAGQDPFEKRSDVDEADATVLERARQRMLASLGLNEQRKAESVQNGTTKPERDKEPAPAEKSESDSTTISHENSDGLVDGQATIHATLDMLVTIIGEFYGQRDLLDGRVLWDEMR